MTDQITVPRETWDALREALDGIMRWQVKNVNVWHNSAYDIAHEALTAANAVSGLTNRYAVQPQEQGEWKHCSPELLASGVSCRDTPRRPCECEHGGSHDHWIAHPKATEPASCHQTGVCLRSGLAAENHARLIECARRLVEHADFALGGILSADSKAKDIPSKAVSQVKSRHLAALRDALPAAPEAKQ